MWNFGLGLDFNQGDSFRLGIIFCIGRDFLLLMAYQKMSLKL